MGSYTMTDSIPRVRVEGFFRALASCDMQALEPYLDDEVSWTIGGPVDILPFCGRHVGKAKVIEMLGHPLLLDQWGLVLQSVLVDGDRAAVLGKLVARLHDVGHAISYRVAQFVQFRNGQVIEYTSLIDSFDAVEQVLGHRLAGPGGMRRGDDLVAV